MPSRLIVPCANAYEADEPIRKEDIPDACSGRSSLATKTNTEKKEEAEAKKGGKRKKKERKKGEKKKEERKKEKKREEEEERRKRRDTMDVNRRQEQH